MKVQLHPKPDDSGVRVEIRLPSRATGASAWRDTNAIATVVPAGAVPSAVCGIAIESWASPPIDETGWEALVRNNEFEEPAWSVIGTTTPASGAVVVEPDGRFWVVSPTNQFGGYVNTFPKGSVSRSDGLSLRANALKEVFEESGLRVELVGFLVDAQRSTSTTRYYLARRLGGNPADMGWESQAVHLVPAGRLRDFVAHRNDRPVVEAGLRACGFS